MIEALKRPKSVIIIEFPIVAERLAFFARALGDRRPVWCRDGEGALLYFESNVNGLDLDDPFNRHILWYRVTLLSPTIEELGPPSPVLVGHGAWPDLRYIPVRRRFFAGPRYDDVDETEKEMNSTLTCKCDPVLLRQGMLDEKCPEHRAETLSESRLYDELYDDRREAVILLRRIRLKFP